MEPICILYFASVLCQLNGHDSMSYACIKTKPPPLSVGFMIMSLFVISFCKASCSPFDILELNGLYSESIFSINLTKCCDSKSLL